MTVSKQSHDGTQFHHDSAWKRSSKKKPLHETYQCRMYSKELLMMGRENVRNMLPTRRTNYPNLLGYKTLHVSGILSAYHQEFSTVHSAQVDFMQFFL